jgi:hypothetical protein
MLGLQKLKLWNSLSLQRIFAMNFLQRIPANRPSYPYAFSKEINALSFYQDLNVIYVWKFG